MKAFRVLASAVAYPSVIISKSSSRFHSIPQDPYRGSSFHETAITLLETSFEHLTTKRRRTSKFGVISEVIVAVVSPTEHSEHVYGTSNESGEMPDGYYCTLRLPMRDDHENS